jgi:hypothetical protein
VSQEAAFRVDPQSVSEAHQDHDVATLLGGGLLSDRMRHGDDAEYEPRHHGTVVTAHEDDVTLAAAKQIEIESGYVRFLVPFAGRWPSEHWLRAYRHVLLSWPPLLVEPLLDEGRGVQLGPLPAVELDAHVRALKELVAAANLIYTEQIEPELRRQREEALRREEEEHRLQAEVEAKLKSLLG